MSVNIKIYNQRGEVAGKLGLSGKIFNVKVNEALVHQAVVTQMANERQVLAHTKDRSEVRGGGKKPWRQKGTGRARAGSNRSPIWIGGGVTFGPTKDRNFKKNINKKMKQKALFMALTDKVKNNSLLIIDKLEIKEYKTKMFNEMLKKLLDKSKTNEEKKIKNVKRNVLIIMDKKDEKIKYSGRNLEGVEIINIDNINILDLLKYRNAVFTAKGIKALEKRYQ